MPKSIFSFFSGAGLLDLAFEEQNYNIVFVNEFEQEFLKAYQYARAQHNILPPQYGHHLCSIDEFLQGDSELYLLQCVNRERQNGNLIGFIGGPPCPDFSVGGKNKGRHGDNGRLAKSYIDIITRYQPDFFVFENVKGLVKTAKHREYYEELKQQLRDYDYYLSDSVLNSLCFGAPQDRERILLIGIHANMPHVIERINENGELNFPWMQHAVFQNVDDIKRVDWPSRQPFSANSRRNCPRQIPDIYRCLTVEYWFKRNRVNTHPNGNDVFRVKAGAVKMQTIEEGDVSRKSFKRLHRWRYSPTAAYGNNEVHLNPYLIRRLSVAEAMAIQSLPAWFCLPKELTLTHKFKVIGNGVPVLMAEAIAQTLSEFLDDLIVEN